MRAIATPSPPAWPALRRLSYHCRVRPFPRAQLRLLPRQSKLACSALWSSPPPAFCHYPLGDSDATVRSIRSVFAPSVSGIKAAYLSYSASSTDWLVVCPPNVRPDVPGECVVEEEALPGGAGQVDVMQLGQTLVDQAVDPSHHRCRLGIVTRPPAKAVWPLAGNVAARSPR